MKKVIEFNLRPEDRFFLKLKNKFLEVGELGNAYDVTAVVNQIIAATIETLKEEVKEQKPNSIGVYNFTFEKKENIYPYFHDALENNIDVALNRKVHTTTVERFCDLIEQFMVDTADEQAEEKRVKINPLVDPDKELQAITNYVASTWDGFDKVNAPEFFKKIWTDVTELTKNKFDEYAFHNLIVKIKDDYPSGSEIKTINDKVQAVDLSVGIMLGRSFLAKMVNNHWDFEKNVNEILAEVKKEFPDFSQLKPKGWSKMAKSYRDYEGMSELDTASLRANFKGMDSGTAGASSFEVRVSLPHVMYDDKCQGRKPLEVLVGSMLGHAYVMSEQNNSSKMLTEWLEICNKLEKSNAIQHEFKEPLNKALNIMITSQNFNSDNPQALTALGLGQVNKKKLKF